jgi:uncharacterized protein YecT (DUF1311 family)
MALDVGSRSVKITCWEILLISIALFGLFSTQATAASFDCKKAATWLEKTVCSNPELSKLDDEMAKAYSNALKSLSPEGQKETKEYQKKWLKEISSYSKAKQTLKFDDNDKYLKSEYVLKLAYEKRIRSLQQTLIKFPGRIFRYVHVDYSETDKFCNYEFAAKYLVYPQIENQRDENEKLWNERIFKDAHHDIKLVDKCDDTHDVYDVIFSNKRSISLQHSYYSYAHGTPHGFQSTTSFCWLLEAKRKLEASDLFDNKTGWRKKLTALAHPKLKKQLVANGVTYEVEPSTLMEIVTSSDAWMILKDGLGIQFNEWSFGNRVNTILITIDWKTLDPYLSKNGRSLIND